MKFIGGYIIFYSLVVALYNYTSYDITGYESLKFILGNHISIFLLASGQYFFFNSKKDSYESSLWFFYHFGTIIIIILLFIDFIKWIF